MDPHKLIEKKQHNKYACKDIFTNIKIKLSKNYSHTGTFI